MKEKRNRYGGLIVDDSEHVWRLKIGTMPSGMYRIDMRGKIKVGNVIRARCTDHGSKVRYFRITEIIEDIHLLKVDEV